MYADSRQPFHLPQYCEALPTLTRASVDRCVIRFCARRANTHADWLHETHRSDLRRREGPIPSLQSQQEKVSLSDGGLMRCCCHV